MKKKDKSSEVITREYLDEALVPIKEEIDLKYRLLKTEIIDELTDIVTESTSKLYTRIDPLLAKLENTRVDRELTTDQIKKLQTKSQEHDRRLKKLETN